MTYVELMTRSSFSFLQGAATPEALVEGAAALGYEAMALTDVDGLYGMVRAMLQAEKCGLRLIVGCTLHWIDAAHSMDAAVVGRQRLTLHVESQRGYQHLCELLTESHRQRPHGKARQQTPIAVPLDWVCERAAGLWGLVHVDDESLMGRATINATTSAPAAALNAWQRLRQAFGERLSLAVHRHFDGGDAQRVQRLRRLGERLHIPLCAVNAVCMATPADKPRLDVLHCIRHGVRLEDAGRALLCNKEAYLKSSAQMQQLFADLPEAIERTRVIADACRFSLRQLRYRFPCELEDGLPDETADAALRRLTLAGAARRYGGTVPATVQAQIDKELRLIASLEVAPYFLSIDAIVRLARRLDILCQGRGSAANSAVCFCLGITAVDPARSNLLFERFLSAERREPPDIDIDFEHERREEIIQAVYQRYGRDRAAMVSAVICYRGRMALRDVAKVFGMEVALVDRLVAQLGGWDPLHSLSEARLRQAGLDPQDRQLRQVLHYAAAIQGFPRHVSVHVGGFVLSAAPLSEVAPVEPASMAGRTIIPWDKDDLDALGFFKVDLLALGMLSAVRKALALAQGDDARLSAATAIDRLACIPAEDPAVYEALQRADSVGVFQIESRAQMAMLPRLRPQCFYDLVVQVAIVRPGPIQGGMVHPYLRRRAGIEASDLPHPSLAPILTRTLGVPLFQEQVMQLAIVGAGYSGGEADQLRRDMAAWRRHGRLEAHRQRLLSGFAERGIEAAFAERIYAQIQGFGEYGFPESHAASFALLVYASAWLKVHHPAAFAAALLNSQPMGFYSPYTIVQDAARHGVELRPVCVQRSAWDCTLERSDDGGANGGPALRLGLRQVRGFGAASAARLVAARQRCEEDRAVDGAVDSALAGFASVAELVASAGLHRGELRALAAAGALEALVPGRRQALWQVAARRPTQLFAAPSSPAASPSAAATTPESLILPALRPAEQLLLDLEQTGLALQDHPLRHLRASLPSSVYSAAALRQVPHGKVVEVAGLVICRQRPQTASGIVFLTLEDETGFLNLVCFSKFYERHRAQINGHALLRVQGQVEHSAEGVLHVIATRVRPLDWSAHRLPRSPSTAAPPPAVDTIATTALDALSRNFH